MTSYRAILFLSMLVIVLTVLGLTSERVTARLAWVGVALLSLTVGCWVML